MGLEPCGSFSAFLRRKVGPGKRATFKRVDFGCGRSDCPRCRRRKQERLIRRLYLARWTGLVCFWTITTDPKVIEPDEAIKTLNRRWHAVHRGLMRIAPGLRYFRVTELTRSGLPHIHLITDCYIPWRSFQNLLVNHRFGEVLHYKPLPVRVAIRYACKYISKELYLPKDADPVTGRRWMATQGLLPKTTYHEGDAVWEVLFIYNRHRSLSEQLPQCSEPVSRRRPPPDTSVARGAAAQRSLGL